MNTKSEKNPVSPPPGRRAAGGYIAAAVLFMTAVFLWLDHAGLKRGMQSLEEQNSELQQELAAAQFKLDASRRSGSSKPDRPEPVEEPETLLLENPSVSKTPAGLVARFGFRPDGVTELPEQVTLVVRIPGGTNARILRLEPISVPGYSSVEYLVNAQGNLGMIEGSPTDLSALEFELTVSEAVKATVRGSAGIRDFELDIAPGGCTVRPL